jgi:hypothetical protein
VKLRSEVGDSGRGVSKRIREKMPRTHKFETATIAGCFPYLTKDHPLSNPFRLPNNLNWILVKTIARTAKSRNVQKRHTIKLSCQLRSFTWSTMRHLSRVLSGKEPLAGFILIAILFRAFFVVSEWRLDGSKKLLSHVENRGYTETSSLGNGFHNRHPNRAKSA